MTHDRGIQDEIQARLRSCVVARVCDDANVDRTAVHKWMAGTRALRLEEAVALTGAMGFRLTLTVLDSGLPRQRIQSGTQKT